MIILPFTENRDKKRQQRLQLSTVSPKTGTTEGRLCKHRQLPALLLLVSITTHIILISLLPLVIMNRIHVYMFCCLASPKYQVLSILVTHLSANLPDGLQLKQHCSCVLKLIWKSNYWNHVIPDPLQSLPVNVDSREMRIVCEMVK